VLALRRHPPVRWVKYAGNWSPEAGEPLTYAFQRWWLRKGYHRGVVTINGRWPGQPPHVHSFFNPCLTDDELACAKEAARGKSLETPIRLMYAGRLEKEKGVGRVLKVLALLNSQGYPAVLDLAGDGPERTEFENQASRDGIGSLTTFHGWLPRPKLNALYSRSHFFVMPSLTEGWPKVLSEAMAYGVVPLGSAMGSIPQLLEALGTGKAIPADDVEGYYEAILAYRSRPQVWKAESDRAVQGATQFTYSCYLSAVRELMGSVFGAKERPINGRAGRS